MFLRNLRPASSGYNAFDFKMEAAGSSETLITSYHTLHYHKPEDLENIEFEMFK
jgi:hypothetical protein